MLFDEVVIPGISGSGGKQSVALKVGFMAPESLVLMYRLNESVKAVFGVYFVLSISEGSIF